jgi:hypothetical protein
MDDFQLEKSRIYGNKCGIFLALIILSVAAIDVSISRSAYGFVDGVLTQ